MAARGGVRGIARNFAAYALPLGAIALLAAVRIPWPLHGDQTVFLMGAESMQRGGVLYVDFWDTKQPGIFLFYWLAGRLFGFSSVGVHLFELLWHLVLAAWMIRLLRPRLSTPGLASMGPVLAIGGYYAVAGAWELTQVEMLASLPLFACLAGATADTRTPRATRLAWFGSGLAAGVVALFKLLLAPIPVAIWIVAGLRQRTMGDAAAGGLVRDRWLPAVFGTVLVLGVATAAFAATGALESMLWTNFVYPGQAMGSGVPADPLRFLESFGWFVAGFWPLALFATAAILPRGGGKRTGVYPAVFAWWSLAFLVILIQKLSWWRYHMLLLLLPAAILAVRGLDAVAERLMARFRAAPALAFALALLACVPFLQSRLGEPLFPPRLETAADLIAFQRRVSPAVDAVWTDTAFLRAPDARPGPIYVFGDPRTVMLAGRRQAIAINGWSWESYAKRQWDALPAALEAAAPAYVGVEPMYEPLLRERAPQAWAWLERNYTVVQEGETRTWYERRSES